MQAQAGCSRCQGIACQHGVPPGGVGKVAAQQHIAAIAQNAAQEVHNHIIYICTAANEILEGLNARGGQQHHGGGGHRGAQLVGGDGEQKAQRQEHGDVQQQLGSHDGGARIVALRDPDEGVQIQVVLGGVEGEVGVEKENGEVQQRGHTQSQGTFGQMVKAGTSAIEPGDVYAVGHIRQNTHSRQHGQQRRVSKTVAQHSENLLYFLITGL